MVTCPLSVLYCLYTVFKTEKNTLMSFMTNFELLLLLLSEHTLHQPITSECTPKSQSANSGNNVHVAMKRYKFDVLLYSKTLQKL